jgi:hypothetical protein
MPVVHYQRQRVRVNPRRIDIPGALINGHSKTGADARHDDLPHAAAGFNLVSQSSEPLVLSTLP